MSELDERRRKLKQDFTEARGYWSPIWDDLLRLDPDFFAAASAFGHRDALRWVEQHPDLWRTDSVPAPTN